MSASRATTLTVVFLPWAAVSLNASAGELDSYRYVLLEGRQHEVCRHMQTVYNRDFRRPHHRRDVKEVNGVALPPPGDDELQLYMLASSFHPTSREFDAVRWEIRRMNPPKGAVYGPQAILVGYFDIDNDGKRDVVVKAQFNGGSAFGFEELWVYESSTLDPNAPVFQFEQLWKAPRFVGHEGYVRPFIFKDTTYLHTYDYRRATQEEVESGIRGTPFRSPEYVWISKYKGGVPEKRGTEVRETICKFEMQVN